VNRVAVLGCGEIGSGWAALFATRGIAVSIVDPDPDALARAHRARDVARSLGDGSAHFAAIDMAHDVEHAVSGAEWVLESVPEDLELKRQLLRRAEEAMPTTALLSSSTSSFRRTALASTMHDPSRLLIVHPLQPVYAVPIIEINADPGFTRNALDRAMTVLRQLGREPVLINGNVDGLVANRLTAALLREAFDLVVTGAVTAADLDRIVARGIALGWAVRGPFGTEITGAAIDDAGALPDALQSTLAPLWRAIARWDALPVDAREAAAHALRESLGRKYKTHVAGESTWAETLSRVARAAEKD
jgi:3-hydroxyacyl-CoA dehydrogenase